MGRPSIKEQLMLLSQPLLITRGFEGVSVGEIVNTAGVPKGSFYNHFSSKELFAVEHVERYRSSLRLEDLRDDELSALVRIRHHFTHQIAARTSGLMPVGCLLGALSTGVGPEYPNLLAAVQDSFACWIGALADAVSAARDAGETIADLEPLHVAAALVDAFEGAISRAQVTGELEPLEVFMHTTLPALVRTPPHAR